VGRRAPAHVALADPQRFDADRRSRNGPPFLFLAKPAWLRHPVGMTRNAGACKTSGRTALAALFVVVALAAPGRGWAQAGEDVDVALALTVDVSLSMAEDEARLQRGGYAKAFRDPSVVAAITGGRLGRIAVAYIEWSSTTDQRVLVDWRVISDGDSALAFAQALDGAPFRTGTTTSISAGVDFAVNRLRDCPYRAERRVIDVSGDGYNDYGRPMTMARDAAVAAGIVINGLPVMGARPAWREQPPPDLDRYYAENVVGGPGAFSLVVRDLKDFGASVMRKLILEIAGRREPGSAG
jgi:hypothetical protein